MGYFLGFSNFTIIFCSLGQTSYTPNDVHANSDIYGDLWDFNWLWMFQHIMPCSCKWRIVCSQDHSILDFKITWFLMCTTLNLPDVASSTRYSGTPSGTCATRPSPWPRTAPSSRSPTCLTSTRSSSDADLEWSRVVKIDPDWSRLIHFERKTDQFWLF